MQMDVTFLYLEWNAVKALRLKSSSERRRYVRSTSWCGKHFDLGRGVRLSALVEGSVKLCANCSFNTP